MQFPDDVSLRIAWALSPDLGLPGDLGLRPRLVWRRAFGPDSYASQENYLWRVRLVAKQGRSWDGGRSALISLSIR